MRTDRPAHLFVDIGFEQLRAPITVIAADETVDGDIVEKAGGDDFLAMAVVLRETRTLQQMVRRCEAMFKEVHECRRRGHFAQSRIVALQHVAAGRQRAERNRLRPARDSYRPT